MPTISGIEVRELQVNIDGDSPRITFKYKPSLPTLIDVAVTSVKHGVIGSAFINDGDPTNNEIILDDYNKYVGDIIWLKIVVHHPALNKYDFNIYIDQGDDNLTTYNEKDELKAGTLIYEGFILKGEEQ
jgi:hypothetical protein